ncbi:MAG: hypothetical protein GSR79_10125 [Desulfurococcales archaeon]|nr:hypothetical protein [Desulfurococcales archaeon]
MQRLYTVVFALIIISISAGSILFWLGINGSKDEYISSNPNVNIPPYQSYNITLIEVKPCWKNPSITLDAAAPGNNTHILWQLIKDNKVIKQDDIISGGGSYKADLPGPGNYMIKLTNLNSESTYTYIKVTIQYNDHCRK